ncbi:MAG: hypothetical protein IT204_17235 [Fimbriimonadaceae bacterium]|nr:hypothetical protein [Fimbriimonadaceae bacterium]
MQTTAELVRERVALLRGVRCAAEAQEAPASSAAAAWRNVSRLLADPWGLAEHQVSWALALAMQTVHQDRLALSSQATPAQRQGALDARRSICAAGAVLAARLRRHAALQTAVAAAELGPAEAAPLLAIAALDTAPLHDDVRLVPAVQLLQELRRRPTASGSQRRVRQLLATLPADAAGEVRWVRAQLQQVSWWLQLVAGARPQSLPASGDLLADDTWLGWLAAGPPPGLGELAAVERRATAVWDRARAQRWERSVGDATAWAVAQEAGWAITLPVAVSPLRKRRPAVLSVGLPLADSAAEASDDVSSL